MAILDMACNATDANDVCIHVKVYAAVDWETKSAAPKRKWTVIAGVMNWFNPCPSFAVPKSGLVRGRRTSMTTGVATLTRGRCTSSSHCYVR